MIVKTERDWNPEKSPSFWINHASRLLMRLFEQRLRPLGFGMAYLPVVIALQEATEDLLQRDLAARAHVEQPSMAALLARMARDGLVKQRPHKTDKRASTVQLTPKARAAIPQAKAALATVADRVMDGFTPQEQVVFLALLKRAVHNLDAVVQEDRQACSSAG